MPTQTSQMHQVVNVNSTSAKICKLSQNVISRISLKISNALRIWICFWFAPVSLIRLGLMRILLAGTLLVMYVLRSFRMDYFDGRSFIPRERELLVFPEFYRPFFSWNFWPDNWAPVIHGVFLLLLLVLLLGLGNRLLTLVTWILHMGFIHRNYSVLFGADVIGGIFLFYISWTNASAALSIRNILFPLFRRQMKFYPDHFLEQSSKESDLFTPVFYRLIQIQICTIYAFTGFEKLKGVSWWDGTALWTVFANSQMTQFDLTWLRHIPSAIAIMTFSAIIFEIYFPAAMLSRHIRPYWLAAGVAFHLGIGILMGLLPFSFVMMSTYFLFLNQSGIDKIGNCVHCLKTRIHEKIIAIRPRNGR